MCSTYGSGYPGITGRGVAGRGFPFWFWPVVWGNNVQSGSYLQAPEVRGLYCAHVDVWLTRLNFSMETRIIRAALVDRWPKRYLLPIAPTRPSTFSPITAPSHHSSPR